VQVAPSTLQEENFGRWELDLPLNPKDPLF